MPIAQMSALDLRHVEMRKVTEGIEAGWAAPELRAIDTLRWKVPEKSYLLSSRLVFGIQSTINGKTVVGWRIHLCEETSLEK
jgi:hypothetical protein